MIIILIAILSLAAFTGLFIFMWLASGSKADLDTILSSVLFAVLPTLPITLVAWEILNN